MADLQKSDALWLAFLTRVAVLLIDGRDAMEIRDRYSLGRTAVVDLDPNANTKAGSRIVLNGLKWLTNTDTRFRLRQRVTGGPTPYTVKWYKATGGGGADEVATGTANANAVAAMTAVNSSGLTGSVPLAASVTGETDDKHQLIGWQDKLVFARNVFDGTDPEGEDAATLLGLGDSYAVMARAAAGLVDEAVRALEKLMVADPANENLRAYGSKFLGVSFTSLLQETAAQDGDGGVTINRTGALVALLRACQDETTGSEQTFLRRLVAAAAGVAESTNDGLGTIASHTPESHCPTGTLRLECVAGYGSGKGGAEEFELTLASDVDDRTFTFSKRLVIKQAYHGEYGVGGPAGSLSLQRTFSKTGDSGNDVLAASGFTVDGENEDNTAAGDLTVKLVLSGATYFVELYRASGMAAGDLVARSTVAVAANAAFTCYPSRESGLTLSGTLGDTPSDGATCTLHLNYHKSNNAAGVRDAYTIAITLTEEGDWARVMAKLPILGGNGWQVNGVASGELRSDDYVKANCLPALLNAPRN